MEKLSDNPALAFHPAKPSTSSPCSRGIVPPLAPAVALSLHTHIHGYTRRPIH